MKNIDQIAYLLAALAFLFSAYCIASFHGLAPGMLL